jgi:signal transduction histidine kinase
MDTKEAKIYIAILIAAGVLGIILIYFLVTLMRHQKKNLALYKEKIQAEITTLENERKRVAADLHDELGPIVAGIKLRLGSLDVPSAQDKVTLEKIHQQITELIGRMKGISNDLMPVLLLKKGFIEALEVVAEGINSSKVLRIKLIHEEVPALNEMTAINLFRMLQEIIHNTLKHAGATELKIEVRMEKDNLILLTSDNGKGFDYKLASKEHAGLGLRNLLSRTEMLGGSMYVESFPGKGTSYTFEIPQP